MGTAGYFFIKTELSKKANSGHYILLVLWGTGICFHLAFSLVFAVHSSSFGETVMKKEISGHRAGQEEHGDFKRPQIWRATLKAEFIIANYERAAYEGMKFIDRMDL